MASRATKSLYDTDFAEWSARTAALIRSGRFNEIDAESVAEEIEDLGKSERSAAWSHLSRLLLHKIKQVLQPERDCASWWVSITSSRQAIRRLVQSSPSLRPYIQQNLQEIYQDALELALIETGLEHAAVQIGSSRQAIRRLIQSSPSLRPYIQQNLQEIYQDALELALIETGLEHAAV